jgi:hypothetical protein
MWPRGPYPHDRSMTNFYGTEFLANQHLADLRSEARPRRTTSRRPHVLRDRSLTTGLAHGFRRSTTVAPAAPALKA